MVFEIEALLDRRRFALARAAISRALQSYPGAPHIRYLGAFLDYADGDAEVALKSVDQLLADAPEHHGARRLRAHLLKDALRLAEAEQEWINLLREYPEDAGCYAGYAELTLHALQLEKAEALAGEGLRHDPEHAACLYIRTMVSIARGSASSGTDDAALRRLLAAHPDNQRSSIALVVSLSHRGDNNTALRVARGLLRAQPDSQELLELVKELRRGVHWSMIPLYPMQRWGWGGAIGVTIGGMLIVSQVGPRLPETYGAVLSWTWLAYVAYSWIWPPLFKKLHS